MRFFLIRHIKTGEFMPELKRGRGYSHWNPDKKDSLNQVSEKKLTGTPRLFPSRRSANGTIARWNSTPNGRMTYRSAGPFGEEDYDIDIKDDGRKKEDLEVVEVELVVEPHKYRILYIVEDPTL